MRVKNAFHQAFFNVVLEILTSTGMENKRSTATMTVTKMKMTMRSNR